MMSQDGEPLMVSIWCTVYNQESYVRQCLEGFVNQKTNFRFEAIVHDDASTDKSVDIIREYAAKYPNIIKPIYELENQYSKGDGSLLKIKDKSCKGKYIAICEGDDYWIDPLKLQKQVDFLESHPDYALCFHNVKVYKQQEGVLVDDFITREVLQTTTIHDLFQGNYIHSPSVVYRNDPRVKISVSQLGIVIVLDYVIWVLTAQYGKIYKFNEEMAVYRFGSGIWSSASQFRAVATRTLSWLQMLAKLAVVVDKEYQHDVDMLFQRDKKKFIEEIDALNSEYNRLQTTHAYRLGKSILSPFKAIKKLFKH